MSDHEKRVHDLLYSTQSRTEMCERVAELEDENEKLRAENKNLIANYEMLSVSYKDSKRVCEHLFTELKRYKSLLRAKLPERELMLIDEIQKLRELVRMMLRVAGVAEYATDIEWQTLTHYLRELGIEVDE